MKKNLLTLVLGLLVFSSCSKDDDTSPILEDREDYPIQDFMYQAMNVYYLYKADIPELADTYFTSLSSPEYAAYLAENPDPDAFFYDDLLSDEDRFSFLTDDYVALENSFAGTSKTDGIKLVFYSYNSGGSVYATGLIRYVAPGSPAAEKGLKRGQAIVKINGEKLTISGTSLSNRAIELLSLDNYTLAVSSGFNTAGELSLNTNDFSIVKEEFTENPIYLAKTLDIEGQKIGYLMYNSFVSQFDDELNDAFAQFKADGITDLVLDLRYNGGGSVATAIDLTSMITGQFEGELLIKEQWNAEAMAYFEAEAPESLLNRFNATIYTGTTEEQPINSLNLNRLYVIGTGSTASASELTIIGLKPYIPVTLIGTNTVGKFQASATLYDGDNFGKENINPDHKYAIQPLIYTYSNSNGVVGPPSGLTPDISIAENEANFGTLGDPSEPLLAAALESITGKSFVSKTKESFKAPAAKSIGESDMFSPAFQRMYDNNLPFIKK